VERRAGRSEELLTPASSIMALLLCPCLSPLRRPRVLPSALLPGLGADGAPLPHVLPLVRPPPPLPPLVLARRRPGGERGSEGGREGGGEGGKGWKDRTRSEGQAISVFVTCPRGPPPSLPSVFPFLLASCFGPSLPPSFVLQGAGWPSLAKICVERVPPRAQGRVWALLSAAGNAGTEGGKEEGREGGREEENERGWL